ncbi:hypothetical protein WJX77_000895 [Trebouxia sp. C0004]
MARSGPRCGVSTNGNPSRGPPLDLRCLRNSDSDLSSASDSSGSDSGSKDSQRSKTAHSSVQMAQTTHQERYLSQTSKAEQQGDPILGGAPEFCGSLSTNGLIRIDCNNYPAHWQEIQLPEEVVLAWKEYRSKKVKAASTLYTITPRVWVDGKVSNKPCGEAVKEIWASYEQET